MYECFFEYKQVADFPNDDVVQAVSDRLAELASNNIPCTLTVTGDDTMTIYVLSSEQPRLHQKFNKENNP